jgi:hypothetical protein
VFTDRVRILEKLPSFDFAQLLFAVNPFQQKVRVVAAHVASFGHVLNPRRLHPARFARGNRGTACPLDRR